MKYLKNIAIAAVVFGALCSCEKDNITPIEIPPTTACEANLPAEIIPGMTVKAGCSLIQIADTANFYLRPVAGGEDIKVFYGDRYAERNEIGRVPFNPWDLIFTPDESLPDGEYQLVLKRDDLDIVVKRVSRAPHGNYDDQKNEPVTTDNMKVVRFNSEETLYSPGKRGLVYGDSFKEGDRVTLVSGEGESKKTFTAEIYDVRNGSGMFQIPNACEPGNYELRFARRVSFVKLVDVEVKEPVAVEGIVMPDAAVSSEVKIKFKGALDGDKITLMDAGRQFKDVDAQVSDEGVTFTLPSGLAEGPILVLLERAEMPALELGYISTKGAIEITGIPESGFGSIPDKLPFGYPYNAGGKPVELSLTFQGEGFFAGDKIRFNNVLVPITRTQNTITFVLNTQGLSGNKTIELVRGGQSVVLKEVEIVKAPRIGDYAQGGAVIWNDPVDPIHGLVANLKDFNPDGKKTSKWVVNGIKGMPETSDDPRASLQNTQNIVDMYGEDALAAKYCLDLEVTAEDGTVYDDWALPSKEALNQMMTRGAIVNYVAKNHKGTPLMMTKPTELLHGYASSSLTYITWGWTQSAQLPAVVVREMNIFKGDFYVRAVRNF